MLEQVQASAGAGKTFTLTSAYLDRLLGALEQSRFACGRNPEPGSYCWTEILAVTFTNKAAAEMKERILHALKQRALGDTAGPAGKWPQDLARAWVERIIRRLGSLQVRTIDSLLNNLISLSALLLELPPELRPVFDSRELFVPLYEHLVNRAAYAPGPEREVLLRATQAAIRLGGFKDFLPAESVQDRLFDVLEFRLRHDFPLLHVPEPLEFRLQTLTRQVIRTALSLQKSIAGEQLKAAKHFLNFLDKCVRLEDLDSLPASAYLDKEHLDACLNKASKGAASPKAVELYEVLKKAGADFQAESKVLKNALQLMPYVEFSGVLLDGIETFQARQGQLLSSLWPEYARRLLSGEQGVSEAVCRLGDRLAHMLIDEFQDTSREQWEALCPLALEALAKGGGLFYVGDIKQAIYNWRGGDSRLFHDVPKDAQILSIAGEAAVRTLPCNWRSARRIVEFNNTVFSPLGEAETARNMAAVMLDSAPGAVREEFAAMLQQAYAGAAQQLPPGKEPVEGYVRLETVRGDTVDALEEDVKERLGRLFNDELIPRRAPGDIAVLVRSNSDAQQISEWLIEWGLPVVTENSLALSAHPLIRELCAFLTFLDYPYDDLALWEVVDGRYLVADCAPESAVLQDWFASRGKEPLFGALQRDFPELWEGRFAPFYRKAGFMGPYDTLYEIVARFGLLKRFPENELFIRRFLEIAYLAEEQGHLSLSSFMDYWREQGDMEKAPLPEEVDAVRVLTVHKSKGLEFPVVVIPFFNFASPARSGLVATDCPEAPDELYPPDVDNDAIMLLTKDCRELGTEYYTRLLPQLLEQLNLLYVAWTRPREELYTFVTRTARKDNLALMRILDLLLAPFGLQDDTGEPCELGTLPHTAPPAPASGAAVFPEPLNSCALGADQQAPAERTDERPMGWLPRLKIFRSELDMQSFGERQRGTLLHRCIEHLRPEPGVSPDAAVDEALRIGLYGLANPHDPAGFELNKERLAGEFRPMLAWLLDQPRIAAALAGGYAEQTVLTDAGKLKRPDHLAITADEVLVLEYKSGGPSPDHPVQVREYLGLLGRMPHLRDKHLHGLIIYLDQRRIEAVGMEQGAAS